MSVTLTGIKTSGQITFDEHTPITSPSYWDPDKVGVSRITYLNKRQVRGVTQGNGEVGGLGTAQVSDGKWYWEIKITSLIGSAATGFGLGICLSNETNYDVNQWDPIPSRWIHNWSNGSYYVDNVGAAAGFVAPVAVNDICQFALDVDNGYFYTGRNGIWLNGATTADIRDGLGANHVGPQLQAGQTWSPMYFNHPVLGTNDTWTIELNAGHEAFAYEPPGRFVSGI